MNKKFLLYGIQTTPKVGANTNVVTLVRWGIEFEKNGEKNQALVETVLPEPKPGATFIPVNELTRDKIIGFALAAQGGNDWLSYMSKMHEGQLDISAARKSAEPYVGNLQLDSEQFSEIPVAQP
jgi:hypothetical protein